MNSAGLNPYALVSLTLPSVKAKQQYDMSVTLSMPRSSPNVEMGNFMVNVMLVDGDIDNRLRESARAFSTNRESFGNGRVVFESRRPTLVPFVDPLVSLANRILFLFYHLLFPSSNTVELTVPLAERVQFSKLVGLPAAAYIEVEAGQTVQIYKAWLTITAQLRGLRWLMFHYRFLTYVTFTFMFWICEVMFMCVAWILWTATTATEDIASDPNSGVKRRRLRASGEDDYEDDKDEEEDEEEDRPHTFPTYGRQPALKHEPVKKESGFDQEALADIPAFGGEADDEDESEEDPRRDTAGKKDSGIGTSYSEEGGESVRKRSSRNLRP